MVGRNAGMNFTAALAAPLPAPVRCGDPEDPVPLTPARAYFPLIDPLRGFAALTILVYHAIYYFDWQDFPASGPGFWFKRGWMAVDIFFVLSGFVITLSALNLYGRYQGATFLCKFLVRRAARILPLYYLSLGVFIAFMFSKGDFSIDWHDLGLHLLLLHTFSVQHFGSLNGVNWSIGIEAQFYLALALLIPFLNIRSLLWLATAALICTWGWRTGAFYLQQQDDPQRVLNLFVASVQLPGMADEFCAGILGAFFVRSDFFQRLRRSLKAKAMLCAAIFILTALIFWLDRDNSGYWQDVVRVVFFRSLIGLDAALFLVFLCAIPIGSRARKWLATLAGIGTVSYGIYLFHLPIVLCVKEFALPNHVRLALVMAVTLLVATCSWHFFEKKFLRRGSGKLAKLTHTHGDCSGHDKAGSEDF